jgi:tRNA (adenine37-N6)-methyltransferase
MEITINPIGTIRTPYKTKEECPIQPLYSSSATGFVELSDEYEDGLKDIESFSHLYLLYALDRAGEIKMVRATFLDDDEHGVFASRHPARPNGIGLSIVRLLGRKNNVLTVEGVDMLDDAPLLDIKPYLPKYDLIGSANEGWTAGKEWRQKPKDRE